MPAIRSFIALPTSPDVRNSIQHCQNVLRAAEADVRWEPPEKLHLTVKFLGSVEIQTLQSLITALESTVRHHPLFAVTYTHLGAFPSMEHPRVVWLGAEPNPVLAELQVEVESLASEFGIAREDRTFHPHITLGRVKSARNIRRLTEILKSFTLEPANSPCTELLVLKSELRPSGSVYSIVKSIPFHSHS